MFESWMVFAAEGLVFIGGAYGGATVALNSTRERVREVQAALKEHVSKDEAIQDTMIDRLARIETKIDFLKENAA